MRMHDHTVALYASIGYHPPASSRPSLTTTAKSPIVIRSRCLQPTPSLHTLQITEHLKHFHSLTSIHLHISGLLCSCQCSAVRSTFTFPYTCPFAQVLSPQHSTSLTTAAPQQVRDCTIIAVPSLQSIIQNDENRTMIMMNIYYSNSNNDDDDTVL